MTRRLAGTAVLLLACAPVARAQAPFEGVVHVSAFGSPGRPALPMIYMAKGKLGRTEYTIDLGQLGKNKVVTLIDLERGRIVSLRDATRNYIVVNIDALARGQAADQPPFVATGRKETVAGEACEHHTVNLGMGVGDMDFCVASGLGHLFFGATPVPLAGRPTATEMTKQFPRGFFPLKVTAPKGEMLLQVTRIERKTLPDALFVPPPGYTEVEKGR